MDILELQAQDFELIEQPDDEAFASVSLNPTFRWCKFILTDDQPNLNKKRIPMEEFDNLIKTGIFAPIKMEMGQIGDHLEAVSIGVITALKKAGNVVKGLGALWSDERPEDVAMLKEKFDAGEKLNLSWEVNYSEGVPEDGGVVALKDTALKATTFVRLPAYAGRTPILEFASMEGLEEENSAVWTTAYMNDLPDSSFLYIEPGGSKDADGKTTPRSLRHLPYKDAQGKIDLPHLRNALARIPQSNLPESVKSRLTKRAEEILNKEKSSMEDIELEELELLKTQLAELQEKLEQKDQEIAQLTTEKESLASFKNQIEKEQAEVQKLTEIKTKFVEAGIEKSEEYFAEKREMLLGLEDNALDFMIQELVAFASTASTKTDKSSVSVPNFSNSRPSDAKDLGKKLFEAKLREQKK